AANQKLFRFLLEKCHSPILKIKEKQFGLRRHASGGRCRGAGNQTIRSNKVRAPFNIFDQVRAQYKNACGYCLSKAEFLPWLISWQSRWFR
ncbi:MAG: hypothetical protein AAB541_04280, partial [Patescibacteria group bacterium]